MCGVADDDSRGAVVVGRAGEGDEGEVGVGFELGDEGGWGDEVGDAREGGVEEGGEGFGGCGEAGKLGGGEKEGAGEGPVERGDGDEHPVATGPDVEVVGGDWEFGRRGGVDVGRDGEFAPQRVDVLLLIVHARILHEVVAGGGVGAISTNEEVESDFEFLLVARGGFRLEPGFVVGKVCADELVVEENLYVGH